MEFLLVRFLYGDESLFGFVNRLLKRRAGLFFRAEVRLRLFDVATKLFAGRAFGFERGPCLLELAVQPLAGFTFGLERRACFLEILTEGGAGRACGFEIAVKCSAGRARSVDRRSSLGPGGVRLRLCVRLRLEDRPPRGGFGFVHRHARQFEHQRFERFTIVRARQRILER